jgi:hypothetical protein
MDHTNINNPWCSVFEHVIGGDHGHPTVFDKGPLLMWASLQAALIKMTISGIHDFLNYCVICLVMHYLRMWLQASCDAPDWRCMVETFVTPRFVSFLTVLKLMLLHLRVHFKNV